MAELGRGELLIERVESRGLGTGVLHLRARQRQAVRD
jgi:hypothetical protein